ncbi:hypothetical protein I3760_09G219900 [Carya illinoinensis]|nr:hypothetical protein I3760_09G199100 [Carya illinoinensis]KAG2691099.1 hypothetical protein I3760_09G219900 [Carya illinoinensis]
MMYVTCGSSVYSHDIYGREAPSSRSSSLAGDNHSSLTASLLAQIRCLWPRVAADDHGESSHRLIMASRQPTTTPEG